MSLRRLFRRRPHVPFAEWGAEVRRFDLPAEGVVEFAQWRHPCVSEQPITQEEVDGLRQFIRPGDFVIDVGAHTGDSTVPLALACGPTGRVLALEPNRHVYKILEQNASLNAGRTRIDCRCCAATPDDGTFVFHYGDASFCNGGAGGSRNWNPFRKKFPLQVEGRNLLQILRSEYAECLPWLSYVKVDAEGFDRQILESILPILRERQPVVRTEVFKRLSTGERQALFDLLTSAGYELHRYAAGGKPVGPALARNRMNAERHFDVIALPKKHRGQAAA
jgi:FkbM family methyltransferase